MSHGLSWYSGFSAKFISSVRLSLTSRYKLVLASPQFCHHNITSFYFLPTASLIEIFYLLAFERRRQWHPTLVLLPGKSHGRRSLVGCSPWDCKESDTTERLHFPHFHALEKEIATHSSVLGWRIPGTAEPGGLRSMGSHRVGHD